MRGGVRAAWRGLDRAVAGAGGRARAEGKRPVDSRFRAANLQSVPRRILPRPQPSGAPRADRGESPGDRRSRRTGSAFAGAGVRSGPGPRSRRGAGDGGPRHRKDRGLCAAAAGPPGHRAAASNVRRGPKRDCDAGQALDLAEPFDPELAGVILDVFHLWWDPRLYEELRRASGRIFGLHVSDWAVPLPGIVTGRSMMGEGVIEIRRIRRAIDATGYSGPIEVEIMNEKIWAQPIDDTFSQMIEAFRACVID